MILNVAKSFGFHLTKMSCGLVDYEVFCIFSRVLSISVGLVGKYCNVPQKIGGFLAFPFLIPIEVPSRPTNPKPWSRPDKTPPIHI